MDESSSNAEQVFVSSTCYDLVDLRAELRAELCQLGLRPKLSDHPDFDTVKQGKGTNSIERCLSVLEGCSFLLCVIGARYGPRLARFGYPNISATHLEWQHAKKLGIQRRLYVRRETWGAYAAWKRRTGVSGVGDKGTCNFKNSTPLRETDAKGIFRWLLEEEQPRELNGVVENEFIEQFDDSTDLKLRCAAYLERTSQTLYLRDALARGVVSIPVVSSGVGFVGDGAEPSTLVGLKNMSASGISDVELRVDGYLGGAAITEIPPLQSGSFPLHKSARVGASIAFEFSTTAGLRLRLTCQVVGFKPGGAVAIRRQRLEVVQREAIAIGPAPP